VNRVAAQLQAHLVEQLTNPSLQLFGQLAAIERARSQHMIAIY
jgi:hypothetical protein